jgi:hypothetical protein
MGVRTIYTYNKKSTVKAEAYLGAVIPDNKVGEATLVQGSGSDTTKDYCAFASYGQTCSWDLDFGARFDTLRLTAVAGAFGVVGESTFALQSEVDKALSCTDPTLTQGNAAVEYIGNADGSECGEFGVTLEAGDEEIVFLKPLDLDPDAQFIFDVTWTEKKASDEGDPAATEATVPGVTIDFENYPAGFGDPIVSEMPFCPDYLYGPDPDFTAPDDTPQAEAPIVLLGVQEDQDFVALPDWREDLDGKQYACLDQPRQVNISAGKNGEVYESVLTVNDRIYLIGDARMRLG